MADRALDQVALLVGCGWLVLAPLVVLLGPDGDDLACLGVLAAMAVVGSVAWQTGRRQPHLVPAARGLVLALVPVALLALDLVSADPDAPSNPAVSLLGTTCLIAGLRMQVGAALGAAIGLAVWQSGWTGVLDGAPLSSHLEVLLTTVGAATGAWLVTRALARSADQVSAMVTGILEQRREEREQELHERNLVAARADLHDTVLTTLAGIGAGWLRPDSAALRDEVRRDIRVLSDLDAEVGDEHLDLVELLADLSEAPLFERMDIRVTASGSCPVPAVVSDAFALATREALVNTLKHAGTADVQLRIERTGRLVRVVVRDAGLGFLPQPAPDRLGLGGLSARMAVVGGSATVSSAPGQGTTVLLEWTAGGASAGTVPPLWSVEGPRRGAVGVTVVAGISQTLAFAIQAGAVSDLRPGSVALGVALTTDALVIVRLARGSRLPGWLSAVLIVRIAVVLLLAAAALPGCAAMTYAHFSGGGEFLTCVVVTMLRPRREAVGAAVVSVLAWATLAVPLYARGETCGITAVVNATIVVALVVGASTFVTALHRHAALAAEVLATQESLSAARSAHEVRAAVRRRLLPVVADLVATTLSGLADGTLDPAEPSVRAACQRDARLLRSFLARAGEGDHLVTELFARSVQLREVGVDLSVRGSLPRGTVPADQRRNFLQLLDASIAAAIAAGWAAALPVTVLQTADAVLVTAVLRDLDDDIARDRVLPAVAGAPVVLHLADLVDGDLWLTCRLLPAAAIDEVPV